jgi:hypothetical protein
LVAIAVAVVNARIGIALFWAAGACLLLSLVGLVFERPRPYITYERGP